MGCSHGARRCVPGYWRRAGGEKLFHMIFLTRVQVNIYDRTRAHKIEHIF